MSPVLEVPDMRVARRFVVSLVAAAALASCGSDPLRPADPAEIAAARARWTSLGIRDYEYVSEHYCFCPTTFIGPLRTVVRNGVVVLVEDATTGESRPLTSRPTIDGWFDQLEFEVRARPDNLVVSFDPTTGVPRAFTYGTPANDAGGNVRIRRFRVLSP